MGHTEAQAERFDPSVGGCNPVLTSMPRRLIWEISRAPAMQEIRRWSRGVARVSGAGIPHTAEDRARFDRITGFAGDIRDPHGVRTALTGVDVCMHLAALIGMSFRL